MSYILFGCGAHVEIDFPNNYRLIVISSDDVVIASKDTMEVVVESSVLGLQVESSYVFGLQEDTKSPYDRRYFILDTTTGFVGYYQLEHDWEVALSTIDIEDVSLRPPTAFFNMQDQIWWRVALLIFVVVIVTVPIWIVLRARKQNIEHHLMRQNQP